MKLKKPSGKTALGPLLKIWTDTQIGLGEVVRFGTHVEDDSTLRKQTTLEHKISVLVIVTLLLPRFRNYIVLDESLVIRGFTVHDVGEGILKRDIVWINKSDEKDLEEYLAFSDHTKHLEGIEYEESQRAFLLQFASKNPPCFPAHAQRTMAKLWDENKYEVLVFAALEAYDYLFYGFEDLEKTGRAVLLTRILRNQISRLNEFATQIPGFRTIWTEELQNWCEMFVAKNRGVSAEPR